MVPATEALFIRATGTRLDRFLVSRDIDQPSVSRPQCFSNHLRYLGLLEEILQYISGPCSAAVVTQGRCAC